MADRDPSQSYPAGYQPAEVWIWEQGNGGAFASINRPSPAPRASSLCAWASIPYSSTPWPRPTA
jgi:hypothetical protein